MNEYEQAALRILEAFKELLRRDAGLARLNARIDAGLATYEDAERLSSLTGRELGELISRELLALFPSGPIPREAAEAILPPALRRNYEVVSKAAERVQKALNDRAGLGLAPVRPEHRQERDDNLITYTATQEDFASDAKHFVQLTENNSMMIVDDAVRDNADFHFGAGLSPRIVRKMRGRACAFCRERAGTFDYSVDMNKEVFRRHPNCHCTVEYNPGNGSRKRQNVHSKEWRNATGTERLRDFAEGKAEQLRAAAREKAERLRALTEAGSGESSGEAVEQRKQIGENRFKGEDVTAEYFGTATPGQGEFIQDDNVQEEEVRVAHFLHDTFGGDIHVLEPENLNNVKTPDYLWRGKLWDLKTTHTDKAARSATQSGLKQIKPNPGGIIINMLGENRDLDKTIKFLEDRVRQTHIKKFDVLIMRDGKIVKALRYTK